jgi:hypothetical protein
MARMLMEPIAGAAQFNAAVCRFEREHGRRPVRLEIGRVGRGVEWAARTAGVHVVVAEDLTERCRLVGEDGDE